MNLLLITAAAVAGGAVFYFVMMALISSSIYRKGMTRTERAQAEVDETLTRRDRGSWQARGRRWLVERGLDGDPVTYLVLGGTVYVFLVAALRVVGLPAIGGVLLGVPAGAATAAIAVRILNNRRRRLFNTQLIALLRSVASYVEGGAGLDAAMRLAVASADDPLRGAFERALNQAQTTGEADALPNAIAAIEQQYPSRALQLLVTALRLNVRSGGATLAPVLREAAAILTRDFELQSEAQAEVSQAKGEFFGIVAVIGFICVTLFTGSDDSTRDALLSPIGLLLIVFGVVNFGIGIYRAMRLFAKTRGDV